MARATRWTFTINNPTNEALCSSLPDGVAYIVWQSERAPTTGTLHLQGYVRFTNARALGGVVSFLKRLGGDCRPHVEPARGSEDANTLYCTKEESRVRGPWCFGAPAKPGKRTDLSEAAEAVAESGDLDSVDPALLVKYGKGFSLLAARKRPTWARRNKVVVIVLIGPTAVGKTWKCFEATDNKVFRPTYGNTGLWWDGYTGEEAVLFDEFEGQVPCSKMLQLLDPYPLWLESKGSGCWARYKYVFITSNRPPEEWYRKLLAWDPSTGADGDGRTAQFSALLRRLGRGTAAYMEPKTREDRDQLWNALFRSDEELARDWQETFGVSPLPEVPRVPAPAGRDGPDQMPMQPVQGLPGPAPQGGEEPRGAIAAAAAAGGDGNMGAGNYDIWGAGPFGPHGTWMDSPIVWGNAAEQEEEGLIDPNQDLFPGSSSSSSF